VEVDGEVGRCGISTQRKEGVSGEVKGEGDQIVLQLVASSFPFGLNWTELMALRWPTSVQLSSYLGLGSVASSAGECAIQEPSRAFERGCW